MKVVDASVVLGWLLNDPLPPEFASALADHVSGETPLVAPELLHYEVGNALARAAHLSAPAASEGYERFAALEIETFALGDREYRRSLELALDHGITIYEASYVALAEALDLVLVTADRRLAERLGPRYADRLETLTEPPRYRPTRTG